MSVLKQILNIEYNDGTIKRCFNIIKFIEQTCNFWRDCGDNLSVKKISKDGVRRYQFPGHKVLRPGVREDAGWCSTKYYYTDYKFVVKNGHNNIIHPQVLWDAIIAEYGEPKTKFCDTEIPGCYGWARKRGDRWDRGQKQGCYANRERNYWRNYKQYSQSLDCIDEEPPVRKRDVINDIACTEMQWDRMPRCCSKSWKDQSKRTTQFKGA